MSKDKVPQIVLLGVQVFDVYEGLGIPPPLDNPVVGPFGAIHHHLVRILLPKIQPTLETTQVSSHEHGFQARVSLNLRREEPCFLAHRNNHDRRLVLSEMAVLVAIFLSHRGSVHGCTQRATL